MRPLTLIKFYIVRSLAFSLKQARNCKGRAIKTPLRAFLLTVLITVSNGASGAQPVSEIEWSSWGEFCQINYILSGYGGGSKYVKRIPIEYAAQRQKQLYENLRIPGAHHFCYGVLHLKRAAIGAGTSAQKIASAKNAAGEFYYSYSRLDGKDPNATTVVLTYYGRALWLSGSRNEAHLIWEEGINGGIADSSLIVAKAEALIGEGNYTAAESILEQWKTAGTLTPEINYWLAMALCYREKFKLAEEYATFAEKAGFPAAHLIRLIKMRRCPTS